MLPVLSIANQDDTRHYTAETRVVSASGHVLPNYANAPVPVNATREDLRRVISEHLAR